MMSYEEFIKKLEEEEDWAPGWEAIDEVFDELYPNQTPEHFGTNMLKRAIFGGDNILMAILFIHRQMGTSILLLTV